MHRGGDRRLRGARPGEIKALFARAEDGEARRAVRGGVSRQRKAWAFFESQPPSYRRPATWWVMSAKKDETREKRLATLIEDFAAGRRIAQMTWKPRKDAG